MTAVEILLAILCLLLACGGYYTMWWHVIRETKKSFDKFVSKKVEE